MDKGHQEQEWSAEQLAQAEELEKKYDSFAQRAAGAIRKVAEIMKDEPRVEKALNEVAHIRAVEPQDETEEPYAAQDKAWDLADTRAASEEEQLEALREAAAKFGYALVAPEEHPDVRAVDAAFNDRQHDLFQPEVTKIPHPEHPDRVFHTRNDLNLPGGVLLDTRKFEQWALENFLPLQDRVIELERWMDQQRDYGGEDNLTRSRLGRLEQQVRELKAKE